MTERFRPFLLAALLIFLPLSAWLVSVSGQPALTFIRDLLLVGLFVSCWRGGWPRGAGWWAAALIAWGLLSYFWRDESVVQWLRGVRFVLEPIGLFLIVSRLELTRERALIVKTIALVLAVVATIGLGEYFFPDLVRFQLADETTGYLGQIHLAGGFRRIQSLLAGPNALGLYLAVCLAFLGSLAVWPGDQPSSSSRSWRTWLLVAALIALILTFSRSAWLGLATAIGLGLATYPAWPRPRRLLAAGLVILALVGGIWLITNRSVSALERSDSNAVRLEQYQRLWQQRGEIGLLGRGIGSAGLVSQYRLDGGPNYYTENTYLDTTEGLGLIGGLLYLGLWLSVLRALWRQKTQFSRAVALAGSSLFVAGIFITHYTGQVAIWTFWLLAGLALGSPEVVQQGEDGENRS